MDFKLLNKILVCSIILLHLSNVIVARSRFSYENLDETSLNNYGDIFSVKSKRNEVHDLNEIKRKLFGSLNEKYHKIGTERGFQISTAFDFVVENGRIVLKPRDNNDNHYFIG
jgi:hypothetical protein